MNISTNNFELVAKTFKGLENVLAGELKNLGAQDVTLLNRAVSFVGDKALMYKSNLWLRTALKILKPINKFKAKNEIDLYKGISQISWSNYFNVDDTLSIQTIVNSSYFNHSQYVALKAKDAIVDQFRNYYGKRPSIDTIDPTVLINIHIYEDECDVSIDSSGESLHKRGYRVNSTIAPINEVLAAGLILLSGWDKQSDFLDPMCGSGTIPIEAALLAYNIPPGIFRKNFGFEKWKDFDPDLLEKILNFDSNENEFHYQITGSDISPGAIRISIDNAKNASISNKIVFKVESFEGITPPEQHSILIFNPPYGERIKKTNLDSFYEMIGNQLKRRYAGHEVWILSGNKDAMEHIGLHPSKKFNLNNGNIECKFQQFDIYSGSKKAKKIVTSSK